MPKNVQQLYKPGTSDKIYFFRHLILDGQYIKVPIQRMTQARYAAIQNDVPDLEPAVLSKVKSLGAAIASLPLKVESEKIIAVLPMFSPERCTPKTK